MALVDYDDDGRLDIYTVSAFDLDEKKGRARIPHRNALYRNMGNMTFKNVAAEAGVEPPHGAMACARATTTATAGSISM